jgi:antibiotic biosynthesis monooxygenase (ABM) superfamily enzyme
MSTKVEAFPGSLGAGVLRPGVEGGDYHLIFRFTDALSLRLWERSPQRARLVAELDGLVGETRVQRTVGVEEWFDLPERAEPSRALWKHVFGDVAWVFPVALTSSIVVAPYLAKLPLSLRTLASAGLITLVMRTAVGPVRKRVRSRRTF